MATYFKPTKVARWSGTLDDIVELSGSMIQEIEERTKQAPRYAARIEGSSLNAEFGTPEEMRRSTRLDDLHSMEKLTISVGDWSDNTPLSASIVLSREPGEPAVVAQTRGTDRVQVEGLLSATIQPFLERGRRKLNLSNTTLYVLSMLLLFALFAGLFALPIDLPNVSVSVGYLLGSIIGGILGFLVHWGVQRFANWIYPPLELLGPGQNTQFDQSRKWVYGGVFGMVVVPVLVNVLGSVITGD